ncbi:putative nuclease HARBI1 [Phalaenopsis equestris]|uniref:putative nuclease HARBI1 n=1 Tax=Phalaenopsis equestris TaxID=78828 RepID=UPI0009E3A393|nr:putative nuclease HARBI1 [Phalaenopsis equestris]
MIFSNLTFTHQDCIGAIDGTHVDARNQNSDKVTFIGRCGSPTQNVMAVCDFNMCFTFVMAGWEGSAHARRGFKTATRDPNNNFPHPPTGKYYLVDAGYPLQRGYLKPFPDTRYHIPDFARASNVTRGRKEMFNKRHSSLRGVIERTFGVWKKKWVILRDMPPYNFSKQVHIVCATMALHNYIRRHHSRSDIDFHLAEEDEENMHSEAFEHRLGQSFTEEETEASIAFTVDGEGASEMVELRERITDEIVCSTKQTVSFPAAASPQQLPGAGEPPAEKQKRGASNRA